VLEDEAKRSDGVLILGVLLCVSSIQGVAIANTMVLRLAHEMPTNHPYHLGAENSQGLLMRVLKVPLRLPSIPMLCWGNRKL